MEMIILLAVISLVLGNLPRPSALPMTDYSQLNHDEPTHWTKAATTHVPTTGEYVAKRGTVAATESTKAESPKNETPTLNDQENDLTTKSGVFNTNDIVYPENETTTNLDLDFEKIINSTQKVENLTKTVKFIKVTEPTTDDNYDEEKPDHFYRYDLVEDLRKLFTNDLEKDDDKNATAENEIKVHKFDYNQESFDSEQEEEELKRDEIIKPKLVYDALAMPTLSELDESYDADTPFKKWDRDSEEQEKLLENIVFQANNDTFDKMEIEKTQSSEEQTGGGRWFLLLLAGNSTIVRLRQKDFAKYLKLNLAARLSLEYDEVKLNKVVLAPPRLMVNVSVIPSSMGNLDEEFDLNERLFGEEEAPLHKLAETNATLLELSGEEYHVVRFLSLRSQQPLAMDEVASETSVVITDHHADIEKVVYIWVGMICIFLLIPLIVALCRLYLFPAQIKWPWKRDKPLFGGAPWSLPRHQRMEEPVAPIGGPLTVIYSGAFVDRNGPPSGSWIDENYQSSSTRDEPNLENPVYGLGSLEKATVRDICDPSVLESPRFNLDSKLRILGCRPNHLLIPHTPIKRAQQKSNLDLRIPKGLDNPNYQT